MTKSTASGTSPTRKHRRTMPAATASSVVSVKIRDAGIAAAPSAAVAATTKSPRVRMLRPTSARTSSSRPARACSLSWVKYGVPIESTMIE